MSDEAADLPATEGTDIDTAVPATVGGGKSEIASQLTSALNGDSKPVDSNSKRDQLRNQIDAELAKVTEGEKVAKADAQPDAQGRVRGPDGKFIAKDAAPTVAAEGDAPPEPAPVEAAPAIEPPAAWSKAVKEKWSSLPPDVQAEIAKREADVAKGFEKYAALRSVEPILDVVAQMAPRYGTTPDKVLDSWAGTQAALLQPHTAAQEIAKLANAYLNPQQLQALAQQVLGTTGQAPAATEQAPADPNVWVDPEIAALKQELQGFRSWKTTLEQQAEVAARQHVQAQQSEKLSAIDKFGQEKDASGQPLRPHLESVMPDMVASIARIRTTNPQLSDQDVLQQAYEAAVWSNPDTRKQVLEAQRLSEEKERTAQARARAQAATRSVVSPASASPQGAPAPAPLKGNIRDQMAATLEQLTA